MRYRRLTPSGDYSFGSGQGDFYANVPEAPAQAVLTRLRLNLGDWFLDRTDGTPWQTKVLGTNTAATRDAVIKSRILDTPGVNSILSYSSSFNGNTRTFNVYVRLDTIYGVIPPVNQPLGTTGTSLLFVLDVGALNVNLLG